MKSVYASWNDLLLFCIYIPGILNDFNVLISSHSLMNETKCENEETDDENFFDSSFDLIIVYGCY